MTPLQTPAEVCAASLCWLARFKLRSKFHGDRGGERIATKVESFWHAKSCRFCTIPPEELLAAIEAANVALGNGPKMEPSDALTSFKRLPKNARTARVREAQEEPWYESLDSA